MILTAENLPSQLRGESINVILLDMDTGIHEEVNLNRDGSYTIFINSRLSSDTQQSGYAHAIKHILFDDWKLKDVQEIEWEAHSRKDA